MMIMLLLVVTASMLLAQTSVIERNDGSSKVKITMSEDELVKEQDGKIVRLNLNTGERTEGDRSFAAFFGIYVEDITFPKAQVLGYKDTYGIVITGVTKNGPAWEYRLLEDDIIMAINGEKVMNKAGFDKIRGGLRAEDRISLDIFRSGKIEKIEMVVGSREKATSVQVSTELKKKKLSAGYGGGSMLFMGFKPDMADVNEILNQMGYEEMSEDGLFMTGLVGKLPVGKGYFIGGYGAGYTDEQKKAVTNSNGDVIGTKWLNYSTAVGGVTFDKRIPITSNFVTGLGLMLGGGGHTLEVTKTDGNYTWQNLGDDTDFTNYTLSRGFVVVQPKAEIYYRLLSWLAIRAEAGYVYGYAPAKRWKINGFSGDQFDVTGSPETEFQGFSVSIGPWFGF